MHPGDLVRTYVRRRGRMTAGQARALETMAGRFCLPADGPPIDGAAAFGRAAPLGLEIGFGMGQSLLHWAGRCPDWNLLGIDVYQPGIGSLLLGIETAGLANIRVVEAAAEAVLADRLAPATLDEIRIFFPDPWPKKRHHKRRLIQPDIAALLTDRLAAGGRLWLATDWQPYAEWMMAVLDAQPRLVREPIAAAGESERLQTRFEARGLRLGHGVWDLCYQRKC